MEDQIRVALALDPEELLLRARIDDHTHPDYLKEECLVYLFDEYRCRDDLQTAKAIYAVILTRCRPVIEKRLHALGDQFAASAAEEVVDGLLRELMDAAQDGAMLQVAFGRRLKCLLIDVYRMYDGQRRKARVEVPTDRLVGQHLPRPGEQRSRKPEKLDESVVLAPLSPDALFQERERRALLMQALDALPDPRWRQAVVLHILKGYTYAQLCKYFGMSESMIRIWINKKALPFLRKWMQDNE